MVPEVVEDLHDRLRVPGKVHELWVDCLLRGLVLHAEVLVGVGEILQGSVEEKVLTSLVNDLSELPAAQDLQVPVPVANPVLLCVLRCFAVVHLSSGWRKDELDSL